MEKRKILTMLGIETPAIQPSLPLPHHHLHHEFKFIILICGEYNLRRFSIRG
jgi:hypothetical protein